VVLEVMVGRTPTHAEIERLVESLVRSRDVPRMLVDMSSLDFITSALVARLITINRRLNEAKGSLVLFGLSPFVRDLLVEMRLDGVFQIAEDEEAALATL
jgi:anti-anti-sigma factor